MRSRGETLIANKTEEEFYKALGMDWIPPEIRENRGEIEASLTGKLPKLLELSDIKGDFHIHSDFDIETSHDLGSSGLTELVTAAKNRATTILPFPITIRLLPIIIKGK